MEWAVGTNLTAGGHHLESPTGTGVRRPTTTPTVDPVPLRYRWKRVSGRAGESRDCPRLPPINRVRPVQRSLLYRGQVPYLRRGGGHPGPCPAAV